MTVMVKKKEKKKEDKMIMFIHLKPASFPSVANFFVFLSVVAVVLYYKSHPRHFWCSNKGNVSGNSATL